MIVKYKIHASRVAAVSAAMLGVALSAVKAVDPTLADVATTNASYVTAILTFIVSIFGAFTLAMLVPMGLKKLISYVRKLFGHA